MNGNGKTLQEFRPTPFPDYAAMTEQELKEALATLDRDTAFGKTHGAEGLYLGWLSGGRNLVMAEIGRRNGTVSGHSDGLIETLDSAVADFQKALDGAEEIRVRTHSPSLNAMLGGGFGAGELVYLGARPGVGKTALALQMARSAAMDGKPTLVISREMTTQSLVRRMVSQAGRVAHGDLRPGHVPAMDVPKVVEIASELSRLPLSISADVVSIEGITKAVSQVSDIGFLVVDYLQLIRCPKEIRERRLQVEYVSQGLKELAIKHKMPVLCLSSLSRPADKTKEKRPGLASLRESGELEHDADLVLLMHREHNSDECELIVAKNRNGRVGVIKLAFQPDFVRFRDEKEKEALAKNDEWEVIK